MIAESDYAEIVYAPQHRRLLRTVTRRQVRDAARLLDAQSRRGSRDADTLTAALHRAGFDMRPDGDPFLRVAWLLLGLLLLVASAAMVVGAIWLGGRP